METLVLHHQKPRSLSVFFASRSPTPPFDIDCTAPCSTQSPLAVASDNFLMTAHGAHPNTMPLQIEANYGPLPSPLLPPSLRRSFLVQVRIDDSGRLASSRTHVSL
jgi:hypothetical protein